MADNFTILHLVYSDVKAGRHEECGWPSMAYGVSKIGVTLMARLHQEAFYQDNTKSDIVVNAVSFLNYLNYFDWHPL